MSFVKKCKRDACKGRAVSKEGKTLHGAAKNNFMIKMYEIGLGASQTLPPPDGMLIARAAHYSCFWNPEVNRKVLESIPNDSTALFVK
jgi:hypothetical protein